jgi:hypothetical protein
MAQIHGMIGSLSQLQSALKKENITFFDCLDDIISFNNDFENRLALVKDETRKSILKEKDESKERLLQITSEYEIKIKERENSLGIEKNEIDSLIVRYAVPTNNIFLRLFNSYKKSTKIKRKNILFTEFEKEVRRPLKKMNQLISSTQQNIQHTEEFLDTILQDRTRSNSKQLYDAKRIINENNLTLLGAIGEQKALEELKKLPDIYVIINDFRYTFGRALHKKDTDDWILSIQADHLVVGPSGVFIIETKNWSANSIQSLDLYSPVQQVQRTSYAIFMLLNRIVASRLSGLNHHWGARQIPVNNIILMINRKPSQEFQHVKVLTLNNICQYIGYLKPIFNKDEVQEIASILLANNY